jgi:hypothetical protein
MVLVMGVIKRRESPGVYKGSHARFLVKPYR